MLERCCPLRLSLCGEGRRVAQQAGAAKQVSEAGRAIHKVAVLVGQLFFTFSRDMLGDQNLGPADMGLAVGERPAPPAPPPPPAVAEDAPSAAVADVAGVFPLD